MWWFVVLVLIMILVLVYGDRRGLMKYGKLSSKRHLELNGHAYYLESTRFETEEEAYYKTFKVVQDVGRWGKPLEMKYELYDCSVFVYQFENYTVGVKYKRDERAIQLLKSKAPISIADFEEDHRLTFVQ
ncbi:hypothetical protein [Persicobacter diffluens]|uniref:Uncharacterized protein n=1 Tax=Persicobacter diffluens TaxID=981 RepID=A0AAN4VZD0_9BACT|nr:hypothetical protein PEDI_23980 [Persicobacter diffluens]